MEEIKNEYAKTCAEIGDLIVKIQRAKTAISEHDKSINAALEKVAELEKKLQEQKGE